VAGAARREPFRVAFVLWIEALIQRIFGGKRDPVIESFEPGQFGRTQSNSIFISLSVG
jgi:hypothetical protein